MNNTKTKRLNHGDILVIEDSRSDLKLLVEILKKADYQVRPAADGELAFRSIQAKIPDLILLDIHLPDMNGIDVCRRIKANPETADIPVIFISADNETDLKVKALKAGGIDYVTKPFMPVEIITRINNHLGMSRLQRKLAAQSKQLMAEIQERKQIENALKKSEEKFIKLFRTNPVTITITRIKDGLYLDVNDAFTKTFGWTREEVIGRTSLEIGLWDSSQSRQELVELILKNKSLQDHEMIALTKEGKPLNISLSLDQIEIDKEMCFISTAINISERKQAETALQESEEKYRSMMESIEESAYICSSDLHIKYMNPAMIKRTGYDATGEICHKVMYGLDEKCSWCVFNKISKGESINYELVNPIDDRTYNVSNSPIFHTDGSVSKLSVFHDLTDFKEMEAQLHQSQKMESIGTLAGGTAHDINNILFPIVGHTEMLMEDTPKDSPFQDSLQEIFTASLRAKNLVKQILTFSRQKNIDLKLIKIEPIIKEALKLIRSTIPTTINIKQYIKNDCGIIKADPIQIHQIIMNLSTNASQAMEEAGGDLKVRLEKVKLSESDITISGMEPGVYNLLTVSDTGKGMNKKLVEKIFDPFFTTKVKGKGTGMGLSVVHGIVKNMKGFIKVYSKPGKGTKFNVYLPVVKSLSGTQKIHQMKKPIQGGVEQVLLVDDE
ncbi:MAG: response regulator, partial [Desulfobacteraceae bacterium]|nr:response regulator [Desulfobacteraceae bacterium]